ncbi:MAG: TadE/TadG family type IV pilus assembly protein [Pseudomonadota bacterium]
MGARLKRQLLRFREDRGGGPLLEFILVTPVLLILVLGAIEMSMVYITFSSMNDAAREATRALARGVVDTTGAEALAQSRLMFSHPFVITASAPPANDDVSVTISLPISYASATTVVTSHMADLSVQIIMRKEPI